MTIEQDPVLSSLFADAEQNLDAEEFTAQVIVKTRSFKYRVIAGIVFSGFLIAVTAWIFGVPFEIANTIARVLTKSLVELGDGWLAWAFSPINNIASILVLAVKILRMAKNKILGTYYH